MSALSFIPSRHLPTLKLHPSSSELSAALSRISIALGQQDEIISFSPRVHESSHPETHHQEPGENDNDSDQTFETRFTTDWLTRLVANPLDWLRGEVDNGLQLQDEVQSSPNRSSAEQIVDKAAELLAMFSGKSASGPSTRIYFFPPTPTSTSINDPEIDFLNRHFSDILVNIRDTTLVSDALGGRTWGAAPLLSKELLNLFRKLVGLERNPASDQSLESTSFLRSKSYNILELGAGTGLVGLALAKYLNNQWKFVGNGKSRVVLTDYHPNVIKNLDHNVWLNGWNSNQDQSESERTESEGETSKLARIVQLERDRKKDPRFDADRVEVEVMNLDWQETHHSIQKGTGDQQEVDGNEKYVSSAQTLPFEKQIHAERTSETKDEPKEGVNRKFGKVDENQKFDLLIAADCIYDPYHPEWIKSVATRHLSKPRSIPRPNQTSTSNPDPSAESSNKSSSYPAFARNQLHILSPLRETHQTEIEAIYKAFPLFDWNRDQTQGQEENDSKENEMELMITHVQDLEGFDDFGSPKLDLERESSNLDQSGDEEIDEDERSRLLRLLEAGKELARRKESQNRTSSEVRKYRWFVIEWR